MSYDPSASLQNPNDADKLAQPNHVFFGYRLKRPNDWDIEGDVVILDHVGKAVLVIELKDGDTFDTKKANRSWHEGAIRYRGRAHGPRYCVTLSALTTTPYGRREIATRL